MNAAKVANAASATSMMSSRLFGRKADRSADKRGNKVTWLMRLREDVRAVMERDPSATSAVQVVFFSTGLHAIWAYRRQHWLWAHGRRMLATWLSKRSRRRYGVEIHPAATIGRRLVIDHGMGIVIGGTAIIGDDCLLYQGVTLGMTGKHGGKRHPTLGDRVMVGANAVVLGNIRIGDDVKIGAGAVVVEEVPSDVTVAGVPATIVRRHRCWDVPHLSLVTDDEEVVWSCAL